MEVGPTCALGLVPSSLFFPLVLGARMDAGEMNTGCGGEATDGGGGGEIVDMYAFAARQHLRSMDC